MSRPAVLRLRHLSLMGVIALGLALWGLWAGLRPLSDNSFLTHLATGRLIADGDIPRHDPFTFTAGGERWVVQSWLVAGLYGVLEEVLGGRAVLFFQGVLTTLLAALAFRLARPLAGPPTSVTVRLGLAALAVGVGVGMWSERPLLVGLLLFGLTMLVADGAVPAPVMVPAMWVWANSHGSFPLGLVLLGALALGRRLDGEAPARELRAVAWALAGVALAVVSPLGIAILQFPVELLSRSDVLRNIEEWQAPGFTSVSERLFLVQVVVAVLALVRRPSFRDGVPAAIFLAAALLAARNVAVASLVLIPVTARGLAGIGSIAGDRRASVFSLAGVALAALGAIVVVGAASAPAYEQGPYPRAALAWFGGAESLGGTPTATPDFVGNYLEAVLGPEGVVFIDDRYDMFPEEIPEDYLSLLRARPDWAGVLDRHGIDAVVWEQRAPLAALLRATPSWRIAYADARWLVALRRTGLD